LALGLRIEPVIALQPCERLGIRRLSQLAHQLADRHARARPGGPGPSPFQNGILPGSPAPATPARDRA
jgi:hypothetical protein